MEMDSTLDGLQKVWFKTPYVVYFRINEQQSFSVANLSLADWLPLIHDDQRTANYIRGLIASSAIVNKDADIKGISRSKDNVNFVPIDLTEVDLEETLPPQNMILLDAFEAVQEDDETDTHAAPSIHESSSITNTPPPDRPAKPSGMKKSIIMNTKPSAVNKLNAQISLPRCSRTSPNALSIQTVEDSSSSMPLPAVSISPSAFGTKSATSIMMSKRELANRTSNSKTPIWDGFTKVDSTSVVNKLSAPISVPGPTQTSQDDPSPSMPLFTESISTSAFGAESSTAIQKSKGMLAPRTSKLKSVVWDSFTKVDATFARCQICTKMIKHIGNTTNLMQHLTRMHPIATESTTRCKLNTAASKRKRALSENEDDPPPKNAESQMRRNSSVQSVGNDQQIDKVFQQAYSFADGGTSSEKITNALLYMLATDNCPLSTVENEGFRTLMKAAVPRYNVPSRRTVTRLMDDKYEHLQGIFKREIEHVTALTLTCDIWSDISNRGYLGITVHYLSGNEMKSGCLGAFPLEKNHTALYLTEILMESIQFYGIKRENVTAIVTDNGANIKKAAIDCFGPSKHVGCFAHTVSHIVPDAIRATGIEEIIAKVKVIVTLTRRSVVASDELRRLQKRDGKTEATILKFIQDVPTRWNSTLHMIERFLELQDYVYPVTLKCKGSVELLTHEELDLLRDIVLLLKPVENVIAECSGDAYVTSSLIIPIIRCMTVAISSRNPCSNKGKQLQEKLLAESNRRFKDYESLELFAMATILDPRFKKLHFQKPLHAATAVRKIDVIIKTDSNQNESPTVRATEDENNSQIANDNSLWNFHDKLIASNNQNADCDSNQLTLELRQYLNQPVVPRSENPIEYWNKLGVAYPTLHGCARKHLSVVATSVPSERLFSKACAIKAENRSRLTGDRLNSLLFLGSLDKKYWRIS